MKSRDVILRNKFKFSAILAAVAAVVAAGVYQYDFLEDTWLESHAFSLSLTQIVIAIPAWTIGIMSTYGGIAVFLLMTMESSSLPVPSELVLPFAGFLAQSGKLSFVSVLVLATAGSMIGSYVDYAIGRVLGSSEALQRNIFYRKGLQAANRWFEKYGSLAVFASRFIAGARTLISFPAGAARMNVWKFGALTLVGCLIWNAGLMYAGYLLADRWRDAVSILNQVAIPVAALALVSTLTVYLLRRRRRGQTDSWTANK